MAKILLNVYAISLGTYVYFSVLKTTKFCIKTDENISNIRNKLFFTYLAYYNLVNAVVLSIIMTTFKQSITVFGVFDGLAGCNLAS